MNEFKNHNNIDVRLALADKHRAIAKDKKFSYIAAGTVSLCVSSMLTWSEYEKHRNTAWDVLTVPEDEARALSAKIMKK